jgi:DNA polymerase-2
VNALVQPGFIHTGCIRTGFILQPTYRVQNDVPVVRIFGRLEDGGAFLVEDDRFRPYFFVPDAGLAPLAKEPGVDVEKSDLVDLAGRRVHKVTARLPGEVPALRDRLAARGVVALEADVRFPYRYLIDRGIRAGVEIEGEPTEARGGLVRFRNPELRPADCTPQLRILSLDLETTPDASGILSAALAGCDTEEVWLLAGREVPGAHVRGDERTLLRDLLERIRALDPDVLVGWNVVDFDLRVLLKRCEARRVPGDLGRLRGTTRLLQDPGFTRQWRADVPGRVVIDGIPLVRDAMRLEDYRLETVARAVLDRGKLIDQEAPDAAAEIQRLHREDPAALAAYNLEDARLVLEILEKEGLLALTIERSRLSGMPLDRVGASVASFDRLYLPVLRACGRVAPTVDRERADVLVKGGALLEPQPGLYRRVAVFDFKSLYPSLIRTFALDPLAHALADEDGIEAPNGARFARSGALLPGIVEGFMASREAAKARGDRHADQAIKIMMNAMFGVLGTPSCRFFDPAIANAITGFGQQTLHWTADAFEAAGVRVLYGDTDSVFVQLRDEGDAPETLRGDIEARIAARIEREYGVEPRLVLELERVFDRLFLPRVRGGRGGSKKRYAGWLERDGGQLVIVGLEAVRRDWPRVAKRLQEGMFERLFRDEEVLPYVRAVTEQVRAGELDAELVYVKRIRKGSADHYKGAAPPHVQAARKGGQFGGGIVRYVITDTGPEPVLPGRRLPKNLDRGHYVERVLRPVADAILPELGQSFDEAIGQGTQLSLL